MIVCPNCQHREITGALFCSNCGAQLGPGKKAWSGARSGSPGAGREAGREAEESAKPTARLNPDQVDDSLISLTILDTGQVLYLANRSEITLGRAVDGQPIIPDVDLMPFQGYEAGVSRLHASLKVKQQKVYLIDLGSANGTRVNGKLIDPHIPQPVEHGDVITLGKFRMQIHITR